MPLKVLCLLFLIFSRAIKNHKVRFVNVGKTIFLHLQIYNSNKLIMHYCDDLPGRIEKSFTQNY